MPLCIYLPIGQYSIPFIYTHFSVFHGEHLCFCQVISACLALYTTRLLKEMWVKKKGPGIFFSKNIFLDTTDHENSFPKIRSDPSLA